ncbi:MAG: hypothetical protein GY940_20270 [bacterium]|nr:hypothetical protein [bacterium]
MERRTIIDFNVDYVDKTWNVINQWAQENNYKPKESTGPAKRFQKGTGFLVAPMMFEVTIDGGAVHMEAWIRANLLNRIFSLFILPAEMGIPSGGVKAVAPRKIARKAVNKLLEQLGQPLIE